MKVLILFAFITGSLAFHNCPVNQHNSYCGTACPLTCDNYKKLLPPCPHPCIPGCQCIMGYVLTRNGDCVKPENCPNKEVCAANQRYSECGTACPLTCDNYADPPLVCTAQCIVGCECETGFVKASDGSCVKPENCH